ncbi:hypothetical protein SVIOM74S_05869 [Streptomyces violarus]
MAGTSAPFTSPLRRAATGTALISKVSAIAATTPSHGSSNSDPPRIPINWYVTAQARQAGRFPRQKRRIGHFAIRQASITGIRPAGTSRDSTSTATPCSASFVCACSSRSSGARARIAASQREPFFDFIPRRPSQYSAASPRNAASDAVTNTIASENGAVWWTATTAAELTSAPVGITGTSAPISTSRKSDG